MKILWVKCDFLHPTTRGGQIRTLEMLRRLHTRHEVHYVGFEDPLHPEGPARSSEYCTRAYPLSPPIRSRMSLGFFIRMAAGLFSSLPWIHRRSRSPEMLRLLRTLVDREHFDCTVCDFLSAAVNLPNLEQAVLFQHNVETMICHRHVEHARDPLRRLFYRLQAKRMFAFERDACRTARHVVAVSEADAQQLRADFGAPRVSAIPTGVNVEYFAPPSSSPHVADLVFLGSMNWPPNIDGITYFVRDILPLIRQRRPGCSLAIVGRTPPRSISKLAEQDPNILVSGTVPDVRPYLWGSEVSIVPLQVGGGTRLKIYESMAARTPVVSTTVGAEGLSIHPPEDIAIADTPEAFAEHCLELLENSAARSRMASAAYEMVTSRFSWEQVTGEFEQILAASSPATD